MILETPPDQIFSITPVDDAPPRRARIMTSVPCASCGEDTMETRLRLIGGRQLCPECFEWELSAKS